MGVIRNTRARLIDQITLEDYILDDESDIEVENDANNNNVQEEFINTADTESSAPRRRRQRDGRTARRARRILDMMGDVNAKKEGRMGARKQRRYEHARLLYSSVDPNDICEDFSDILETTVTALSKLFIEKRNMEAWNAFNEMDEGEQWKYLESLGTEEEEDEHCCSSKDPYPRGAGIFEAIVDHRHLQSSAEASFSRMDGRLRRILKHGTLPLEFMVESEEELREFFGKSIPPPSEWSSSVLSGLQRLIIHALSQYLDLLSKSMAVKGGGSGEKFVKVRMKCCCSFRPPPETLADYLKRTHGSNNAMEAVS